MREVVADSFAYFFRRGLGTNLRSTSSLETIERLRRALLAEDILLLWFGLSRVGVVWCGVEVFARSSKELLTHAPASELRACDQVSARDNFTYAGFEPLLASALRALPLGTITVQSRFAMEISIEVVENRSNGRANTISDEYCSYYACRWNLDLDNVVPLKLMC